MNFGTTRPQVSQTFLSFPLLVPGAGNAVPIAVNLDKTRLITTFIVSNPVAGSSVYIGGAGVQATGNNQGLEIQAGTAPAFQIFQEGRQLYELQALQSMALQTLQCKTSVPLEIIPFICWDLTQIFLFSANAAGSQVTIAAFPQMYL